MLATAAALVVSAVLLLRFVSLERQHRSLAVVQWLLALLLVESVLWESPNRVPEGLFHPEFPTSFRLLDTVALAAVAARLVGGTRPVRLSGTTLLWWAFLLWVAAQAVLGLLLGNDKTLLAFEAKAVVYVGLLCVATGVRREEWRSPGVDRLLVAAGTAAAALVVLDQTGRTLALPLPLLPVETLGEIGADLATVLTLLGLLALTRALTGTARRLPLLASAAPMLLAVLLAGQRAALIGLALGVATVLVLTLRSGGRLRLPAGDAVVVCLLLAALLAVPPALRTTAPGEPARGPVLSALEGTISSQGKRLSAEGRLNQWREVTPLIAERPLIGWGLGRTYQYWEPGPREFVTSDITHNVLLDLALRTGLVGVALFLLAFGATVRDGLRALRRRADPVVTAGVVATLGTLVGWLGKGMVESLFEKYRLAVLLGLSVGLLLALARDDDEQEGPSTVALAASASTTGTSR